MLKRTFSLIIALAVWAIAVTAAAQGLRVLYIGDSITDGGWGRSGGMPTPSDKRNQKDMNHIYGHSFMMLCAAQYEAEYPDKNYSFYNRGIGGNTLEDLAARWRTDAIDLNPDVVSILIGANDVQKYLNTKKKNPEAVFDIDAWSELYCSLIDSLKEQNCNIKLILCTPFVAKSGKIGKEPVFEERTKLTRLLAQHTRSIAEKYDAVVVEFDTLFESLTASQPKETYWIWDGIHPTPAGHAKMAQLWRKTVRLENL